LLKAPFSLLPLFLSNANTFLKNDIALKPIVGSEMTKYSPVGSRQHRMNEKEQISDDVGDRGRRIRKLKKGMKFFVLIKDAVMRLTC